MQNKMDNTFVIDYLSYPSRKPSHITLIKKHSVNFLK